MVGMIPLAVALMSCGSSSEPSTVATGVAVKADLPAPVEEPGEPFGKYRLHEALESELRMDWSAWPSRIAFVAIDEPVRLAVGEREIMGIFINLKSGDVGDAARQLGRPADEIRGLVDRIRATGASKVSRWQVYGDDGGYHGGAIVLSEGLVFHHEDRLLVAFTDERCAPESCKAVPGASDRWRSCSTDLDSSMGSLHTVVYEGAPIGAIR